MMRRIRIPILLLFLILCLTLLAGCGAPIASMNEAAAPERTLRVEGTGTVAVEPDIARVTVGVLSSDEDAQAAQDHNDAVMQQVIEAVKAAGVEEKDIQTTHYYAYPRYDYDYSSSKIVGYEVTHMITITIRSIDKVGQVIKAANQAGANQSYDITFDMADRDTAYREALIKAIENAKQKAQAMAGPAGVTLGEPSAVYEGSVATVYNRGGYDMAAAEGAGSVPIQSGTLEVTAHVTIVYDLK